MKNFNSAEPKRVKLKHYEGDYFAVPTTDDGNCAIHAAFGDWNASRGKFFCDDEKVLSIREMAREKIRKVTPAEETFWELVKSGIQQRLFRAVELKRELEGLKNQDGEQLIRILREFQNLRTTGDALGRLVRDYCDFHKKDPLNETFDLDSHLTKEVLEAYAKQIGTSGSWLLPSEIQLFADWNVAIHMYSTDSGSLLDIGTYSNGAEPRRVVFVNNDHFERLLTKEEAGALFPGRKELQPSQVTELRPAPVVISTEEVISIEEKGDEPSSEKDQGSTKAPLYNRFTFFDSCENKVACQSKINATVNAIDPEKKIEGMNNPKVREFVRDFFKFNFPANGFDAASASTERNPEPAIQLQLEEIENLINRTSSFKPGK